ncbi:unnamed protein product [Parnassius apollo]|uniref:(apollo) hypothetical protein n=1 Tax=Parnassius apollo TaxID=110799 RepID=A0A8S3W3N2_PARAO|nr:unnamed protein product [Parnassius apollo]
MWRSDPEVGLGLRDQNMPLFPVLRKLSPVVVSLKRSQVSYHPIAPERVRHWQGNIRRAQHEEGNGITIRRPPGTSRQVPAAALIPNNA